MPAPTERQVEIAGHHQAMLVAAGGEQTAQPGTQKRATKMRSQRRWDAQGTLMSWQRESADKGCSTLLGFTIF